MALMTLGALGLGSPVRGELLPAAAPLAGFSAESTSPGVYKPAFGPVVECDDIERQYILLKSEVVVGEPLDVRLLLRTLKPGQIREFKARLSHNTDVRFIITPPGGQPYVYKGLNRGTVVANSVLSMEEIPTFRLPLRVGFDSDTVTGAALDTVGEYKISAFLNCLPSAGATVDQFMGEFTVTVKELAGDDARAMEIVSDEYKIFTYIHMHSAGSDRDGSFLKEAQLNTLKRVVNEAPKAALRPHAMFVIADYYEVKDQPDEALGIYETLEKDYPDSIFEEEARYSRLKLLMSQHKDEEARKVFELLWQDPYSAQLLYKGTGAFNQFALPYLGAKASGQWMLFTNPFGTDPEMASEGTSPAGVNFEPKALEDLKAMGINPEDLNLGAGVAP